jgi:hypothetical protein
MKLTKLYDWRAAVCEGLPVVEYMRGSIKKGGHFGRVLGHFPRKLVVRGNLSETLWQGFSVEKEQGIIDLTVFFQGNS